MEREFGGAGRASGTARNERPYATTNNPYGKIHPPPGMYPESRQDSYAPFGPGNSNRYREPLQVEPTRFGSPDDMSPRSHGRRDRVGPPPPPLAVPTGRPNVEAIPRPGLPRMSGPCSDRNVNDCEILVYGQSHQAYAEKIEQHLRKQGLKVDLIFPNDAFKMMAFIENIAKTGSIFAVVIKSDNEFHHSVTVHVLRNLEGPMKKAEEHRNMPLATAYTMIVEKYKEIKRKQILEIPEEVKTGLEYVLAERFLTDNEYQSVLHYLQNRWLKQREFDKRTEFDAGTGIRSQEELKDRILQILMGKRMASSNAQHPQAKRHKPMNSQQRQPNPPFRNLGQGPSVQQPGPRYF